MLAAGALLALLALLLTHLATRSASDEGTGAADPGRTAGAASPARTPPEFRAGSAGESPGGPQAPAADLSAGDGSDVPRAGPLLLPPRRVSTERDLLAATRPERLQGRGEIRVRASAGAGATFPERWTLHAGPAAALIGGDRAESRTVEVEGARREVVLADLPLGGYELRASAEALDSEPQLLLLTAPDRTRATVTLVLEPIGTGFVVGSVVDAEGLPVGGLAVSLSSARTGEVSSTTTDALGAYRFSAVRDGEYRLVVGALENPLVAPKELAFQAPTLTMRPIVAPPLCELEVRVLDVAGLVVADASVQGWSQSGGRIEGRTGPLGTLSARFLPPGEYTVVVTAGEQGRGRGRARLEPGTPGQVDVRLGR